MELSAAHHDWSDRLKALSAGELREQAEFIQGAASELGVWEYGGYVPLQPFIVSAAASKRFHRLGSGLQALLVRHALDQAGGDLHRLADIAEWPHQDRWFLGAKRSLSEALGSCRADVFVAGGRPRFLEVNFGTCLNGGTTSSVLSPALLRSPVGVRMRGAHAIASGSFDGELVHWVRRELSDDAPRVALLGVPSLGDEGSLRWAEEQMIAFASHGVPCDFVPLDEAEIAGGVLTWRGRRYSGAVRYFMVTPTVADQLDFIVALEHAEGTKLFGAYLAQLFTSKALLADLYQDQRLTVEQRRLVDHVPWIARLGHAPAWRDGAWVDPVEWAAGNRERAVLKPSNRFGGRGVVVGHLTSEADWRTAVEVAVQEGGHVVQELVRPDAWSCAYWHIGSQSMVRVEAPVLLGPFVVDTANAGCSTRQPITGTEDDLLRSGPDLSLGCVVSA